VYVRPGVEPLVIDALVISTVAGVQTAGGSVINSIGMPGVEMVTATDSADTHPSEFVTVNVYTPPGRFVIVPLMPVPVVVNTTGNRVIVHVPVTGNPFKTTLPDGTNRVGWVIIPTEGVAGAAGWAGITTFAEGTDKHPSTVVTV
jgi:hypothetical protein